MTTGSVRARPGDWFEPTAAAGQLGVLLGDDDLEHLAEIVGAWADPQRVRRLGSPASWRTPSWWRTLERCSPSRLRPRGWWWALRPGAKRSRCGGSGVEPGRADVDLATP
jgi:hypothetical protein